MTTQRGLDALDDADTVIVPAYRNVHDTPGRDVLSALRAAHRRGARIASICTGAFALARAGLLDGKRATTHWQFAADLAARYPSIDVDARVLYVDEGKVLTSAGVASGIDMCLHLLRRDHGAAIAAQAAREVVAAPHREGGQAQFIDQPVIGVHSGLGPVLDWAISRLDEPLTVATIASQAAMSERTFARLFVSTVGITPIRWLNNARVNHARKLLETTSHTVEHVARASGLGTPANFRRLFRRATGVTPGRYRELYSEAVHS
jgi:transcriptional regulator GlxA family with amidase domain